MIVSDSGVFFFLIEKPSAGFFEFTVFFELEGSALLEVECFIAEMTSSA